MKTLKSLMVVSMFSLVAVAQASHDDDYGQAPAAATVSYSDWARVTRVTPQYERINDPRRECRTEIISSEEPVYRGHSGNRSPAGVIIGGVTGGIVGNQVGKGRGRAAATAVGAVVGAIVGDRISNGLDGPRRVEYEPREREIKRCHVVDNWENRLTGYQVDYEYNGRSYSRLMNEDPGRRFKVRVSVEPE